MKKRRHLLFLVVFILLFTFGAFYLANLVENSTELQETISSTGVFGMVFLSFLLGLNVALPVHVAAFAPMFTASGTALWAVVICFAIGTSLADTLAYFIGSAIKHAQNGKTSIFTEKVSTFFDQHKKWVLPISYTYLMLAPTPNEYVVVPLALMGYGYRYIFVPIILGNLIHQAITVYGFITLFEWIT